MNSSGLDSIVHDLERLGVHLKNSQRDRILIYAQLLERWNRRINLTGARNHTDLFRRHILDCLMLETIPRKEGLRHWLDVGSGAGLPGLLIAIMHPEYRISAVEKVAKKATFQREAVRVLGLSNYDVLHRDVQGMADALLKGEAPSGWVYDVLVARAFSGLELLLTLGVRMLRPAGELWAMKGARWRRDLAGVSPEVLSPYHPVPKHHAYRIAGAAQEGVVLVFQKREDRQPGKGNAVTGA